MNELTKKLLKKSGVFQNWNNEDFMVSGKEMEKFAEVIVRECISICKDKERPNLYGVREVEVAIKQHFGLDK